VITFAACFVVLFGLLIVSTCLPAFFKPQWLFEFAKPMLERDWLMFLAVGIRVALGLALLLVARDSAFPLAFKILGWLAIVAAAALPFIGMARIKTLIDWIERLPTFAIRLWVVAGIALGAFLLFGVRPLFV
jgi:hypothetical protein